MGLIENYSIDHFYYVPAGARHNPHGYPRERYSYTPPVPSWMEKPPSNFVLLAHGCPFTTDEIFYFEMEEDARWFFNYGYRHDMLSTSGAPGFPAYEETTPDRMCLWIDGKEIFHYFEEFLPQSKIVVQ